MSIHAAKIVKTITRASFYLLTGIIGSENSAPATLNPAAMIIWTRRV